MQLWLDISDKIQKAQNYKNMKELYHLIKQVFGLHSTFVVPLKSKEEFILFKDHVKVL